MLQHSKTLMGLLLLLVILGGCKKTTTTETPSPTEAKAPKAPELPQKKKHVTPANPHAGDKKVLVKDGSVKWEFAFIPHGTFTMGTPKDEKGRDDDEVQHEVTLTRNFWMQTTEVTQDQWKALAGNNPSTFSACGDDCPVEQVSWYDAVWYANALSKKKGFSDDDLCYELTACKEKPGEKSYVCEVTFKGLDCKGFRLPTEAEWEYAARAGTTGATYGDLDDIAWYDDNSASKTHPTAKKKANAWGLYDMLGNVWEWNQDYYGSYNVDIAIDYAGPDSGQFRVHRGGSWITIARDARAGFRNNASPGRRGTNIGFRLSRSKP